MPTQRRFYPLRGFESYLIVPIGGVFFCFTHLRGFESPHPRVSRYSLIMNITILALASSDWPLKIQGGPGKSILIWSLIIIGVIAVLVIIEWKHWPIWIDSITKNRWSLRHKILDLPDAETQTIKKKCWIGVIAWFVLVALLAMFVPQFGQKQITWDRVIGTYQITQISPAQDFDRRLLTDKGFKLSKVNGAVYPVTFLEENANVESTGVIQVQGSQARLITTDGTAQPAVKTGSAASLF